MMVRCFFLQLCLLCGNVLSYSRPGCPGGGWPSKAEWSGFEQSLTESTLHGPFFSSSALSYAVNCLLPDQSYETLLNQGKGLCMAYHPCANKFCEDLGTPELPAYSVDVRSVSDISTSLRFASQHNIRVAIKSSGHSTQGQSMGKDTLLFWMRHFPKSNIITTAYTDSCSTDHGTTLAVAGGQNFAEVMQVVRNNYHIVTGFCQTVTLGGGWLLGGGLSFTMRRYGYGIDQVAGLTIVLADGSVVQADRCQNQDIFWASLGGGGGMLGVVTEIQYKLHPPTPISSLLFTFSGGSSQRKQFTRDFVSFLITQLPDLDDRWSGSFGPTRGRFVFVGSAAEAAETEFFINVSNWYDSLDYELGFGKPSTILKEYAGWFDYLEDSGPSSGIDPITTALTLPSALYSEFSRSIPKSALLRQPGEVRNLLVSLFVDGDIGTSSNYLTGGSTAIVGKDTTAIHPAMREAILVVLIGNPSAAERVRNFLAGYETSVCYNHHSPQEPNIEKESWGTNYDRLATIKDTYDPDHRFNVYHGVGYRGEEFGASWVDLMLTDQCPWRDGTNFFSLFWQVLAFLRQLPGLIGFFLSTRT